MSDSVTLTTLTLEARRQTDTEKMDANNGFITDAMIMGWANLELGELVGVLSNRFNQRLTKLQTAVVDGTTDSIALPADFLRLDGLDVTFGANQWQDVPFVEASDRNVFNSDLLRALTVAGNNLVARLEGGSCILQPNPPPACTLRYRYTPKMTRFTGPADAFDFVNGWEAMVIAGICARIRKRKEEDPSGDLNEKEYQRRRIVTEASRRNAAAPRKMSSVRGYDW